MERKQMLERIEHFFNSFIKKLVLVVTSTLIGKELVSWLVMDYSEQLYYLQPSIKVSFFSVGVLMLLFFVFFLFSQRIQIRPITAFCLYLSLSLVWTLSGLVDQQADALHCIKIAQELSDGIPYSLMAGQYLDAYRVNRVVIVFMVGVCKIFGNSNLGYSLQLLNAFITSFSVYLLYKYLYTYIDKKIATFIFFNIVLFFPILAEETFAYSNSMGHALGLIGAILFLESLNEIKCNKLIAALILTTLAGMFKGYMYIFLVAYLGILLFSYEKPKKIIEKIIVSLIVVITFSIIVNGLVTFCVGKLGHEQFRENGGVSLLANVNMGLDIYEESDTPGWYTSYNIGTYLSSDCDKNAQNKQVVDDLKKLANRVSENPLSYFRALSKKNHTIWNEPTFGSFFRNSTNFGKERRSDWWTGIISVSSYAHAWLIRILRFYQILVYFGIVLTIIMGFSGDKVSNNIGLLIFFGAYIFFSIWEAKSEYVLIFFFLLILYSAYTYYRSFEKVFDILAKKRIVVTNKKRIIAFTISIVLILVTSLTFKVNYADNAYDMYKLEHTFINTGKHDLQNATGEIKLSNIFVEFDYQEWGYVLYDNSNRKYEVFLNWDPIIDQENDKYAYDKNFIVSIMDWKILDNRDYYTWKIVQLEQGWYVIKSWADGNKVWTYDEDNKCVRLTDYSEGNPNQIWLLD